MVMDLGKMRAYARERFDHGPSNFRCYLHSITGDIILMIPSKYRISGSYRLGLFHIG